MKRWAHAPVHNYQRPGKYIVTAGTYNREHFFRTDWALRMLGDCLESGLAEYGWKVEAWVVFSNHYHFVAESPNDPGQLGECLRRIHARTAVTLNRAERMTGRKVWHQFWDTRIEDDKSYFARLAYVQQNPVRHGLVRRAEAYPYSNFRSWVGAQTDARRLTVASFDSSQVVVEDDYEPLWEPQREAGVLRLDKSSNPERR